MASIEELIAKKLRAFDDAPDSFVGAAEKSQRQVFEAISKLLSKMKVKRGFFAASLENLRIARQINNLLKQVILTGEYKDAVVEFIREFDKQDKLTVSIFDEVFGGYQYSDFAKGVAENAKLETIDLLLNRASDGEFIRPIASIIEQAVVNGSDPKLTLSALRDYIEGTPQVDGALMRYAKTYAHDSFAISDRSLTSVISREVGAEWFFYSGSTIKTSRPFCIARHNKYFHLKEVEAWPDKDWQGEIEGTNSKTIFSYAGGYNCRHSILPVSIRRVPKEVIIRNIDNGNFKPTEFEQKALGL